ncbi:hypothetical protein V7O62_05830 [Methanolobus sp. ZRKC2]|uniref:hypothetical protein n=1 Tax=Methanolobus sp. ZRKC2 TaxID=3125783 RepID=UPI00325003DB
MADDIDNMKIEKMRELCRMRPLIYSDLDHLKKGSTGFLHNKGYSSREIAIALELDLREVESNLKGTGFALDFRKISKYSDDLPDNIGDVIKIRIPSFRPDDIPVIASVRVIQCIPGNGSCGLVVKLLEDVDTVYPMFGKKKEGDEAVVPLEWYIH